MVRLEEFTVVHAPVERCFDLARSVEVHLAGNVHSGESAVAMAGVTSGLIGMAERVTWRAKHFGVWHRLASEITAMDPPVFFQDTMIHGPFRSMMHDHIFRSLSAHKTEMKDVFCFEARWRSWAGWPSSLSFAVTCSPCFVSGTRFSSESPNHRSGGRICRM
jgi:ligand-binding SRPBCC domain-containing protein